MEFQPGCFWWFQIECSYIYVLVTWLVLHLWWGDNSFFLLKYMLYFFIEDYLLFVFTGLAVCNFGIPSSGTLSGRERRNYRGSCGCLYDTWWRTIFEQQRGKIQERLAVNKTKHNNWAWVLEYYSFLFFFFLER